jgi:hypothetical protein
VVAQVARPIAIDENQRLRPAQLDDAAKALVAKITRPGQPPAGPKSLPL